MSDFVRKAVVMNAIQDDSKSLVAPDLATSGTDGSQTPEATTGELLPSITKTTVPERPFGKALYNIASESSRGLANTSATMLTVGAYQQLENDLLEMKTELHKTREELGVCNGALSTKFADLRVAEERISSLRRIQWVSGLLYFVSTVLVGVAVSSPDDGTTTVEWVLLILSAIMILVGLLAPNLFGREKS